MTTRMSACIFRNQQCCDVAGTDVFGERIANVAFNRVGEQIVELHRELPLQL
jgi:hypothetical protein